MLSMVWNFYAYAEHTRKKLVRMLSIRVRNWCACWAYASVPDPGAYAQHILKGMRSVHALVPDAYAQCTHQFLTRMLSRVQWFWLFFTFWGITTHPWHPKGPRVWKLAKKIFQLHPWPAEIFGKNRKMRFFGTISKFNFRSPVRQIFTIFLAWFIYGILNTHKKFYVSKSKTVVTREWPRQCSKYICLQSLESKF